jgi:hypothetical protein
MKKLIMITAFAIAISIPASFGHARIEVTNRAYDQNRDQQWMQSQQQQMEDQRRVDWQREQWQQEQSRRHQRHQQEQDYDVWLSLHSRDYDNSRR